MTVYAARVRKSAMLKRHLTFVTLISFGWHAMPAHASRPIETATAAEKTLKHSITFLAEANSRPTPIDNGQNIIFLKIKSTGRMLGQSSIMLAIKQLSILLSLSRSDFASDRSSESWTSVHHNWTSESLTAPISIYQAK